MTKYITQEEYNKYKNIIKDKSKYYLINMTYSKKNKKDNTYCGAGFRIAKQKILGLDKKEYTRICDQNLSMDEKLEKALKQRDDIVKQGHELTKKTMNEELKKLKHEKISLENKLKRL